MRSGADASAIEWPRDGRLAIEDRARAGDPGCALREGEVVIDAMPAHPESRDAGRASIPRENTETDVDGTSAGWERQRPSAQSPTTPVPVRRERRAELADLQGS